jgi:hypothetical protein
VIVIILKDSFALEPFLMITLEVNDKHCCVLGIVGIDWLFPTKNLYYVLKFPYEAAMGDD